MESCGRGMEASEIVAQVYSSLAVSTITSQHVTFDSSKPSLTEGPS